MNKITELLALSIVDIKEGNQHGKATNLLLNPDNNEIYLTLEHPHPGKLQLLHTEDIKGVGAEYLLIADESVLKGLNGDSSTLSILRDSYILLGTEMVDNSGNQLGTLGDVILDDALKIGKLVLDDGREIEAANILSVCHERVFVESMGDNLTEKRRNHIKLTQEPEESVKEERMEKGMEGALTLGLTLKQDIISEDGAFHVEKGSIITEALIKEAEQHDALLLLAMYAQ